MLFRVTYVTVVPRLVGANQITRANGQLSAGFAATGIAGPLLAGVLSGQWGPAAAIAVDAVTFAIASVGLLWVRLRPATGRTHVATTGFWREFLVGALFLWRHPVLRALTILLTVMIFFWQGVIDLVIFYLKHDLAQPDRTVGFVMAAGAVGTVAGALVVSRLRRRTGFGASWIGSTVLAGLVILAISLTPSAAGVAILATLGFGFTAIGGICSMSLRQEVTPEALLGRVTSAFWTIHFALGPIGAAAVTAAAGRYGVTLILAFCGAAYMFVAALGVFTPIRLAHPERLAVSEAP
jgi:predicted MFS family arabinose efflux permease